MIRRELCGRKARCEPTKLTLYHLLQRAVCLRGGEIALELDQAEGQRDYLITGDAQVGSRRKGSLSHHSQMSHQRQEPQTRFTQQATRISRRPRTLTVEMEFGGHNGEAPFCGSPSWLKEYLQGPSRERGMSGRQGMGLDACCTGRKCHDRFVDSTCTVTTRIREGW